MYYILGLGNPGAKYEKTRHNIGRVVVEEMVRARSGEFVADKFAAALRTRNTFADDAECFLPETFMNKSGDTARYLKEKEGADPAHIIVVYDDVDLPLGEVKVSIDKGSGGHNGARSIESALGTRSFIKVRVGVAQKSWWSGEVKRPPASSLASFVLQPFSLLERRQIGTVVERASTVIETVVHEGVVAAMNQWN